MNKNPMLPEFYIGAPVDSDDLRFREEFIVDVWDALRTHHVVLVAPRRTGKTSIMDHMRNRPKDSWLVVYQNVQDLSHPADFFLTLLDAFQEVNLELIHKLAQGWEWVSHALGKVEAVEVGTFKVRLRNSDPDWQSKWKQHGEQLLQRLRNQDRQILIIVDEFPDMLLNIKKRSADLLREFLAWFRIQRTDPHPKKDRIRWLIGGSVNLAGTLDTLGMVDLINDLSDVELPTLTPVQVREFVSSMLSGRNVGVTSEVLEQFQSRLGRPIPLFMQMATQELYRRGKHQQCALTPADVDDVFDNLVASTAARDKLQHYYSRIGKYYEEPRIATAYAILGKLSLSKSGLTRNILRQECERIVHADKLARPFHDTHQVFNQLLRDLENDFYVTEVRKNRYDFASGLIKMWWRKYYA